MERKEIFLAKVSDNQDPDGFNRIKITFTEEEEVVSCWVPVMSPVAGIDCGLSFIPQVDDMVVVASMNPNGGEYVVLGNIWNECAAPPESGENSSGDLNSDGKNAMTFVKTLGENMIILDDTEGKEKLQIIQNKKNDRLEFIVKDKKISVTSDEEIFVTSKKDMTIGCDNFNFEAEKQLNISCETMETKASKEMNLEASKDVTVKGSTIKIN